MAAVARRPCRGSAWLQRRHRPRHLALAVVLLAASSALPSAFFAAPGQPLHEPSKSSTAKEAELRKPSKPSTAKEAELPPTPQAELGPREPEAVDYSTYKVAELKELCMKAGLIRSGKKSELIERLQAANSAVEVNEEQEEEVLDVFNMPPLPPLPPLPDMALLPDLSAKTIRPEPREAEGAFDTRPSLSDLPSLHDPPRWLPPRLEPYKALRPEPLNYHIMPNDGGPRPLRWEEARISFVPQGATVRGVVEEVRPYGAFVGLPVSTDGNESRCEDSRIRGFCEAEELGDLADEPLAIGEQLAVKILHVDRDSQRIYVSRTQAEPQWPEKPSDTGRYTKPLSNDAEVEELLSIL